MWAPTCCVWSAPARGARRRRASPPRRPPPCTAAPAPAPAPASSRPGGRWAVGVAVPSWCPRAHWGWGGGGERRGVFGVGGVSDGGDWQSTQCMCARLSDFTLPAAAVSLGRQGICYSCVRMRVEYYSRTRACCAFKWALSITNTRARALAVGCFLSSLSLTLRTGGHRQANWPASGSARVLLTRIADRRHGWRRRA